MSMSWGASVVAKQSLPDQLQIGIYSLDLPPPAGRIFTLGVDYELKNSLLPPEQQSSSDKEHNQQSPMRAQHLIDALAGKLREKGYRIAPVSPELKQAIFAHTDPEWDCPGDHTIDYQLIAPPKHENAAIKGDFEAALNALFPTLETAQSPSASQVNVNYVSVPSNEIAIPSEMRHH